MKASRRTFIRSAGIGLAVSSVSTVFAGQSEKKKMSGEWKEKMKLGLASFTFKEFSLDQAIAMTKRVGLKHIALKSFHLPLESTKEQIIAAAEKVRSAGLDLYGASVVVLKTEAEVNQAFDYAKAAGMGMIVAQPVTGLLELLEQKVMEYDIKLAIHNHGPEDKNFPSPITTLDRIRKLDNRIGLCIDIGHVRRSGFDPADCIRKCASRLIDVHIKDLNTIQTVSDVCEVGRGKLDIPGVLQALIDIKFKDVVAFEYEKDLNDPLAGLAESVGYTKGVLACL